MQATRGGATQARRGARTRAQEVVDDVARSTRGRAQEAVEGVVKGAEVVGERVREAFEEARPASHDDLKDLQRELRAINRRLDAIEERLPPPPKPARKPARKPAKSSAGRTTPAGARTKKS